MNTHASYERRVDRTVPDPEPTVDTGRVIDALAVHRDPSVPTAPEAAPQPEASQRGVAWVRPSEMPTLLGSRIVGRGIDLQAELARRARRTPGAAVSKASRPTTRHSIAQPDLSDPSITDRKGLGL